MMDKFTYSLAFQREVVIFIINNSEGYKGLEYVRNSYFGLIEHSILVYSIEVFYKKNSRVPSLAFLKNQLLISFRERDFVDALTQVDRDGVVTLAEELYAVPSKDGDLVLEEIARFASYIELKDTLEKADLEDYNSYESFSSKVSTAIKIADTTEENEGIYLIKDIKERQMNRQATDLVIPSPFYQLNRLTSAGGYIPGSIMVLLDRPKRLKTTFLVNLARKYMAQKKKVLFIDLENGEDDIASRIEQSIGRVNKKEIIKGSEDKKVQKTLRRYNRIGGEVYIRRLPGFSNADAIQRVIDEVYRDEGFKFDILLVDYLALMGSISHKQDDFGRISDAYVDIANLVKKNKIQHCWTANHIQRSALKRQGSRYVGEDIAKCIDIVRHSQAIFGLNRSETEFQNGICRLEIVEQREGVPRGRAYFTVDPVTQRVDELTKNEIRELEAAQILYNPDESFEEEEVEIEKKRTKGDI